MRIPGGRFYWWCFAGKHYTTSKQESGHYTPSHCPVHHNLLAQAGVVYSKYAVYYGPGYLTPGEKQQESKHVD
jgi:hypothetical protein